MAWIVTRFKDWMDMVWFGQSVKAQGSASNEISYKTLGMAVLQQCIHSGVYAYSITEFSTFIQPKA